MLPQCFMLMLVINGFPIINQGKAISINRDVQNITNEISTLIENHVSNSTTPSPPINIIGKAISIIKGVQNSTSEISTFIENHISNSTTPSPLANIIEYLPKWAWIVIGIMSALILCCLCCCPKTLCTILCCPLSCALGIILPKTQLPVNCCLSRLGFDTVGPRARSYAALYQSKRYGGNMPKGSCFSACQSYRMR